MMETTMEPFVYENIRKELDEVKVISLMMPDASGGVPLSDLMKEYYQSEHHKIYNSYKFNHIKNGYDTFDSMRDYFNKLGMVAVTKQSIKPLA